MTIRRAIEFTSQSNMDECRRDLDACTLVIVDLELLRKKVALLGSERPDLNLRFVDDALCDLVSDIRGGPIAERERRFENEGIAA